MKLIDLSNPIEPSSKNPYQQQDALAKTMIDTYATFEVTGYYDCALYMSDHAGTHVDSTNHFNPEGKPVDEIPLEAMYGDAAVLDLSHIKAGENVTVEDLREAAERAGVDVETVSIILLYTGRGRLWGTREYHWDIFNMTPEATEWLIDRGVKVIGVDMACFECDRLRFGVDTSLQPWDSRRYPAHSLMRRREFYIIENLNNLDKIHKPRFTFIGFPLKIRGASGSPIRAVALIEEE
ncbi:MAG: cyclase family protein [Candidatus Geothermarchaeales archaeon]